MSVFPHLGRDSLLARTTVKSRKVSDGSPSALKENCLHHLRNTYFGNEGVGHGLARIFSLKMQDKKREKTRTAV